MLVIAGEGCGYRDCVYLVYDGIHYDPVAVPSSNNSAEPVQTVFPVTDDMRLAEALEIAAEAKKVSYRYSDLIQSVQTAELQVVASVLQFI